MTYDVCETDTAQSAIDCESKFTFGCNARVRLVLIIWCRFVAILARSRVFAACEHAGAVPGCDSTIVGQFPLIEGSYAYNVTINATTDTLQTQIYVYDPLIFANTKLSVGCPTLPLCLVAYLG